MKVQDKTRKKIANSLIDLASKKSIDKITITDITTNCDMTRQIFYRYFIDKFDLINWIYEQDCSLILYDGEDAFSWKLFLSHLLTIFKEKQNFYFHAIKLEDENSLEKMILKKSIFFLTKIVEYKTGEYCNEKTKFLIELHCRGCISLIIEEIKSGMPNTENILLDWLLLGVPCSLSELIMDYEVPRDIVKKWEA